MPARPPTDAQRKPLEDSEDSLRGSPAKDMNDAAHEANRRPETHEDEEQDDGAGSEGCRAGQLNDPRRGRQDPGGRERHDRQDRDIHDPFQERRPQHLEGAQALAPGKQVGSNRLTQASGQHRIPEIADQQDRDHAEDRDRVGPSGHQALPSPGPQDHPQRDEQERWSHDLQACVRD
jgi:hypothetical protein